MGSPRERETKIISSLKNNENILKLHKSRLWKGCFGCMSFINHDFLKKLDDKHSLSNMLELVMCREDRKAVERVIACILLSDNFSQVLKGKLTYIHFIKKYLNYKTISYQGEIHRYCRWGIRFEELEKMKHLPIVKIWYGR